MWGYGDRGYGDSALIDADCAMHQLSNSGRVARVGFPIMSRNAQWRGAEFFRVAARDQSGAAAAIVKDGPVADKPQVIRIERE